MEKKKRSGNVIRFAETNLDGSRPVAEALKGITGVGHMFSNAVTTVSGFGSRSLDSLSQEEMAKLNDIIKSPEKYGIPSWMLNRRRDPRQGTDRHITASTLDFAKRMDINEMKKLKIYRGMRHAAGLPVRGQRTRGSFRKGKTVGVSRQKQQPAKAKK